MKNTNANSKHSRYETARKITLFWCLFIGLGAVAGAVGMLSDPTGKALGMDEMLPYFQVLPFADVLFQNLTFSGWSLLIVNGITNLVAAGLIIAKKRIGAILGGVFGVTLMLWICIQFYMFPLNFMSTIYFIFGLSQAASGYAAYVFYEQERFGEKADSLTLPKANSNRLVVYFSRMGYVKTLAYEEAARIGAEILEIKPKELTKGTRGFWWCGRFGMHRWDMPIEDISLDLSKYEIVTICTPVWVFALSSPVRAFCRKERGKITNAEYIIAHHAFDSYASVAQEMDSLLGVKAQRVVSVRTAIGKIKPGREIRR